MRAKVVILPKTAEKLLPPAYRKRGGGGEGERTPNTLSLSDKAVYQEVLLID